MNPAPCPRCFDSYVMVDWSGSNVPKMGADSIWIGSGRWKGEHLSIAEPINRSTRCAALDTLRDLLISELQRNRRVLLSFDFGYSYPRGMAAALELEGSAPAWCKIWSELRGGILDGPDNRNNRFALASSLNERLGEDGPFWMRPASAATPTLPRGKPRYPYHASNGVALPEFRHTDDWLRRRKAYLQPAWKLYGPGSVGGQILTGIPILAAIRDDPHLSSMSAIWPFETGFTDSPTPEIGPYLLHAEIWPGAVPIDLSLYSVKDAAQMLSLVRHFAELDSRGNLGPMFAAPEGLSEGELRDAVEEEGWILGT